MILNMILGFVIPWMFCIMHLYKRDKLLLLLIAPPTSVLAYVINTFTFYFGFAEVFPFPNPKNIASLPFSLGLYPISAGYLIFFIRKYKKPYFIIFLMTLSITFLEWIYVYLGRVVYGNGWNIYFTFLSYLIPYFLVYGYYKYLRKLSLIK